jgi:hypothetical protein
MENSGSYTEKVIILEAFESIIVHHGVEVHIVEGEVYQALIKTGENRIDNLYFDISENTLNIEADTPCMLSTSYDPIVVEITCPQLKSIRNSSEHTIFSKGVLHFPNLSLFTENYQSNYSNIGDFNLQISNQSVTVVSNGISNITLTGSTNRLTLGYYSGTGIFYGKNFVAQEIDFYHRGENTLHVFPVERLSGKFYSIGNLKSYHQPPIVNTQQHYTGGLILVD